MEAEVIHRHPGGGRGGYTVEYSLNRIEKSLKWNSVTLGEDVEIIVEYSSCVAELKITHESGVPTNLPA